MQIMAPNHRPLRGRGKDKVRVSTICPKHGYKKGRCDECVSNENKVDGAAVHIWKPMVYNDICETPIMIESKAHLKRECKKHNVIAARLM